MQNSLGFSPVDRPGDIRPRRPDDSTLNPLSRPSSQKKTQFYGDIRESLPQRIATLRPDRQNGGGCSLNRTALCDRFPITGNNTGIFRGFGLEKPTGSPANLLNSRCFPRPCRNQALMEQGFMDLISGNCISLQLWLRLIVQRRG